MTLSSDSWRPDRKPLRSSGAYPLVLFFSGLLGGCNQITVAHMQPEVGANELVFILQERGIEAEKIRDEESRDLVFNINVPAGRSTEALRILQEFNLPRLDYPDTAKIFQESGMIPTSEHERAKREVGMAGDLANALRDIPGIIKAHVVVSIPREDPLRDLTEERPRPKAAVVIMYIPDAEGRPPMTQPEVQRFAQGRLPEVRATEIEVLLLSATASPDVPALQAGKEKVTIDRLPAIDPSRGCLEKDYFLGVEVCRGQKKRMFQLVIVAGLVAAILAVMAIIAVLRALRYRKDLTRLTAQFEKAKIS
jgi:type III secretion system YscJ/HrcJ family lipoprotein